MNSQSVISVLATITLLSNILLVFFFAVFIYSKIYKPKFWKKNEAFIVSNTVKIAMVISLTAMFGSLYFSEVAGFEPCELCWFQRIFMYPISILLGISLWKKYKDVFNYVLPMSIIGLIIAGYNYYFQITGNSFAQCSSIGFSPSCSERFFTHFGYITIPFMSFSAFFYIFLLGFISKRVN